MSASQSSDTSTESADAQHASATTTADTSFSTISELTKEDEISPATELTKEDEISPATPTNPKDDSGIPTLPSNREQPPETKGASTMPVLDSDLSSTGSGSDSDDFTINASCAPKRVGGRRKRAQEQTKQTILHTQLVEDRLYALEARLKKFQTFQSLQSKSTAVSKVASAKPEIRRMLWDEWKPIPIVRDRTALRKGWRHQLDYDDGKEHFVVEVLLAGPQHLQRRRQRLPHDPSPTDLKSDPTEGKPEAAIMDFSARSASGVPARVRVRSKTLLDFLGNLNTDISLIQNQPSMTFMRPFKYLVTYADLLRQQLANLEHDAQERKKGKPTSPLAVPTTVEESVTANKSTLPSADFQEKEKTKDEELTGLETSTADELLTHLRLLVQFIDEDLAPIWELRKQYDAGTLRKIYFDDLWHLFRHGQEIRTSATALLQL